MTSRILLSALFLFSAFSIFAQVLLTPSREDASEKMNCPAEKFVLTDVSEHIEYKMIIETTSPFSCFGIGWKTTHDISANAFTFKYRTKKKGEEWSMWIEGDADFTPAEIPSGHYRTDAWFTHDASSHDFIELLFTNPVAVSEIVLDVFDGNYQTESNVKGAFPSQVTKSNRVDCPEFPAIIPRSEWCGGNAPCVDVNAWYTPTTINPTHIVMHHGASPNTYPNGQTVVQNYWNYHVNNLGWADIGYNYVIDKFGNFYEGRHNPNLPTTDVRGAHAGNANSGSIGINFLGNLDVSIATTAQLEKLHQLLAWWFDYKGIDVLGSSGMTTQAYGWQVQPHFTYHGAINPTACPGNDMISRMGAIRLATQAIIDACSDQIPPTTDVITTYDWRGADFQVQFTDEDNVDGSGVQERYSQVLHFNGTEWRAHTSIGQFNDNFDLDVHPDWTNGGGTWAIDNGKLAQTDEVSGNTNLYIELSQDNTKTYLYQWQMSLSGTGANRRGGLHFFVDDPTLPNRGNNYLAWFRADDNAFQFYRNENDVLNMVVNNPVTINVNTTYDCKVTYNPTNGRVQAFLDDVLVGEYIDSNPIESGAYLSIRNGNSLMEFDNLKVRTTRGMEMTVTVGADPENLAPFESPNTMQDACRINTVVKDGANNWSDAAAKHVYIDWTAPETTISPLGSPITDDFQVEFVDEDNVDGSGVDRRFYAVCDFDGTEWRSNHERGYVTDSFDVQLHSEWTIQEGTWNLASGQLIQSDEGLNNTNIFIPLNQNLSNRYLYSFDLAIDGGGTNRRAGFHYFCDQPELANRGNSYFIWFRIDSQSLEFYKVIDNVFSLEKVQTFDFPAGVNHHIDIVYDRITGETFVYANSKLIGEWQDSNPIEFGDFISFRSGNCSMTVDNLRTFRTRYPTADVTVGTLQSDVRYENLDVPTAKVSSVVIDLAHNISTVVEEELIVYWTETSTAGLEANSNSKIKLYPNPSKGDITVELYANTSSDATFHLYDSKGSLVFEMKQHVEVGTNKVNLPLGQHLANGMYQLVLLTSDGEHVFNLVRE